jgi:hypothetical protein
MKKFAWSNSALETFERCPKQYYHLRIAKDVYEKPNQTTSYGQEVHKAFENRLVKNKPLPLDLRHHEKTLSRLYDAPGDGMPEQKMALTRDFQLTGWFDDDVYVRGIIDYVKVNGAVALVIDHKTGRMHDNFEQVNLMAAMLSVYLPEVEKFNTAYYWTKTKQLTSSVVRKEDVPEIWAAILPRVDNMEAMVNEEEFPARQNFLCRKYCPVKSCKYCGE